MLKIVCGAGNEDCESVKRLVYVYAKAGCDYFDISARKDVLEAAAIIKYADMLFSVDTGVIHIASTYNIPIVAIYTEDRETLTIFSPKSEINTVIVGKKEEYLKIINKEEVLKEIKKTIERILEQNNE